MKHEAFLAKHRQFIKTIQDYVRSQKDLWGQIPWLALQADGRTGYSTDYQMAYRYHLWPITKHPNGERIGCINLKTGFIYNWSGLKPATDALVMEIAANPTLLDAQSIVSRLKLHSKSKHAPCYSARAQNRWREKVAKELGFK